MSFSNLDYAGNPLPVTGPRGANSGKTILTSAPNTAYQGTAGNDAMRNTTDNATLVGGGGDDTYYAGSSTTIIEHANGGIDTVQAVGTRYELPENVENMVALGNRVYNFGNDLANIITGSAGSQTIDGMGGHDVLSGGAGADVFVARAGMGNDVINDFEVGLDHVRMEGYGQFDTLADVQAAMIQRGNDVVLDLGEGQSLTFRNQAIEKFVASDFWLPIEKGEAIFTENFDSLSWSPDGSSGTWRTSYGTQAGVAGGRKIGTSQEKQFYSDSTVGVDPFSIEDGVLTISAGTTDPTTNDIGQPYTSGLLTSANSFRQLYGYFEIRAQVPAGAGLWPAFWLMPEGGGAYHELDVMEMLGQETKVAYSTMHETTDGKKIRTATGLQTTTDLSAGFHTYGVDWGPTEISWYLDGNKFATAPTPPGMHQPMYMITNLALGGWAGAVDPALAFPAKLAIDYIHVYKNAHSVIQDPLPGFIGTLGDDVFVSTEASDTMTGGAGTDTVVFAGNWADYGINGNDTLYNFTTVRRGDVTDVISGIEFFRFDNGTFAVEEVRNRAPVAGEDLVVVDGAWASSGGVAAPVSGNALANDADANTAMGDSIKLMAVVAGADADLTATLRPVPGAGTTTIDGLHGRLTIGGDGQYSYVPNSGIAQVIRAMGAGESLTDAFTYQVRDSKFLVDRANLVITLAGTNDAPVAVGDAASTAKNNAVWIQASSLLGNDSDVDAKDVLSLVEVFGAKGGTVVLRDGAVLFTPDKDFSGPASFEYLASDGHGGTAAATVSVSITAAVTASARGSDRDDLIDRSTSTVAQLINGNAGADTLRGGEGNDVVNGSAGADLIEGGGGSDVLTGGEGADVLVGGTGRDQFVFQSVYESPASGMMDTILDFNRAEGDLIVVRSIDANPFVAGDQRFAFVGEAGFSGQPGSLRFERTGDGALNVLGDVDGNGVADFAVLVRGTATLIASDFLL